MTAHGSAAYLERGQMDYGIKTLSDFSPNTYEALPYLENPRRIMDTENMNKMTALCCLSAEETKHFIDSVVENGLPSTTENHHKLGAADVWNFTLSNGDRFQLWERNRAFETVYTYYKQGIGSMQFKTLKSAVQSMKKFF